MQDWPDAWLSRDPLPSDPMSILADWLAEAFAADDPPNPHAFALATVDSSGDPAVRFVLAQAVEADPGALVFYTHRASAKGRDLAARGRASGVFHFGPQQRQARVTGPVAPTPDAESDAYFATRPLDAQLGAWASQQSRPLASRQALLDEMQRQAEHFGVDPSAAGPAAIPRPSGWGGYRLTAEAVELWHSRPGRIHDRALWRRRAPGEPWEATRLHP